MLFRRSYLSGLMSGPSIIYEILRAPRLSLNRVFCHPFQNVNLSLLLMFDYLPFYNICSSTVSMRSRHTIRAVKWIGMTRSISGGCPMLALVAMCSIFRLMK